MATKTLPSYGLFASQRDVALRRSLLLRQAYAYALMRQYVSRHALSLSRLRIFFASIVSYLWLHKESEPPGAQDQLLQNYTQSQEDYHEENRLFPQRRR